MTSDEIFCVYSLSTYHHYMMMIIMIIDQSVNHDEKYKYKYSFIISYMIYVRLWRQGKQRNNRSRCLPNPRKKYSATNIETGNGIFYIINC